MNRNKRFPLRKINRQGCFLFGCILPYENEEKPYCCDQHRDMAIALESAIHDPCVAVDGLSDMDEQMCGSLLRRTFDALAVGIPNLNEQRVFTEPPMQYLDMEFLPEEERRYWVFGHNQPPEVMAYPVMAGGAYRWSQAAICEIHIGEHVVNLNRAVLRCRPNASQQEQKDGEGWALLKYSIGQGSLFCITFNAKKAPIRRTHLSSKGEKLRIGGPPHICNRQESEPMQPTAEQMRDMLQEVLVEITKTIDDCDRSLETRYMTSHYVDDTLAWLALPDNQNASSEILRDKLTEAQTTLTNLRGGSDSD